MRANPLSWLVVVALTAFVREVSAAEPAAAPVSSAPALAPSSPPGALAAAPPPPSSFHFDVGIGTYFPAAFDVEAQVELPYRILVRSALGFMPSPYSNSIVDVIGDFGALNAFEEDLIKTAIDNSVVFRVSAGWRPFSSLGLEALVGYTLVTAGGSVSGADVVDSYLESKGSSDRVTSLTNASVPLRATLDNFDVTVDWRFVLWDDRIVIRPSLGYLQCFASSTSVTATPSRPAFQAALSKANADLQGYLNPYFIEYVKAPLIGLHAYYRF
jgi:hypothetical protein